MIVRTLSAKLIIEPKEFGPYKFKLSFLLPWKWKTLKEWYRRRKLEKELSSIMADEIRAEIDREILRALRLNISASTPETNNGKD